MLLVHSSQYHISSRWKPIVLLPKYQLPIIIISIQILQANKYIYLYGSPLSLHIYIYIYITTRRNEKHIPKWKARRRLNLCSIKALWCEIIGCLSMFIFLCVLSSLELCKDDSWKNDETIERINSELSLISPVAFVAYYTCYSFVLL